MLRFILLLLVLFVFESCQDTKTEVKGRSLEADEIEAYNIHLEDYDEPRYKWAYMDESGKEVIKASFDQCRDFYEGMAAVNIKGAWGFIDKKGMEVIPCQWKSVLPFQEKLSRVEHFDGRFSFINKAGEIKLKLDYDKVFSFENGLARFQSKEGYGFIDSIGNEIIPAQYYEAYNFTENYAIVKTYQNWQVIDREGNILKELSGDRVYKESEGFIRIKKNSKYYFISTQSWDTLPFGEFENASDFNHGISIVSKDGENHFLYKNGTLKPLDYSLIEYAQSGRWMVKQNEKFGMIDSTGAIVIPIVYDMFYYFEEGICCFQEGDLWGFMDVNGNVIKEAFTPLIWGYKNGYARAIVNQSVMFLNKKGELAFSKRFFEVRDFSDGLARVEIYR